MTVVSDNLIHFLGKEFKDSPDQQFDVFKAIINDGLGLKQIKIDYGEFRRVYNYITCFTDIPLSLCDEHIAQYGKFGIGFKKLSIKKAGGHPARYFIDSILNLENSSEPDLRGGMKWNLRNQLEMIQRIKSYLENSDFLGLFDHENQLVLDRASLEEWVNLQVTVLSYDKAAGAQEEPDSSLDQFYKEREWRLVPLHGNRGLDPESPELVRKDEEDNFFYMFSRDDVNMILTPNAETRIQVIEFLSELRNKEEERLQMFAEDPPPVLAYDDLRKW